MTIHHVTAIVGHPRPALAFYAGTLGLRLVKRTVNFDDPTAWHLYFGDEAGTPGTVMTLFSWPGAPPARPGTGEQDETAFRVPLSALDAWADRLAPVAPARTERFGEPVLTVHDPDGLRLALVGIPGAEHEPAWTGAVPAHQAIRGLHAVRLALADPAPTAAILAALGLHPRATEGTVTRLQASDRTIPGSPARPGTIVDLHTPPGAAPARQGRGSVHHHAFRAADDAAQAAMAATLARDHGLHFTAQRDRDYFRSVYARTPGGILFEIATDGPGFDVDEFRPDLGTTLKLPAALRPRRAAIQAALPTID